MRGPDNGSGSIRPAPSFRSTLPGTEPYLLGGPYSLGLSGYYNERLYTEYTEFRTGGQVIVGRQLGTPELTATLAFRGEEVEVKNPIYPDISDINQAPGFHSLFGLRGGLDPR